jgi:phosphoglycolate phosphatase-like HAD superfamily hydrolase
LRPTVLLFDVDGTLILTGGAGRRSMERAFRAVTGTPDVFRDFRFGGMTDLGIVRAGLERVGRPFEEAIVEEVLDTYLSILPTEVESAPDYRVLPGVYETLDRVSDREGIVVGLGTGNVEPGARIKLGRGELSARFEFGGFGSDAEDRAELLTRGAQRGAKALGADPAECRVVVIGDTPRDIIAAAAMGAECVAIATGGWTTEELRAHGPKAAFEGLADAAVLSAILDTR